MEYVCGAFSSELTAVWVGSVATAAATLVAVWIYWRSSVEQRNQSEAQRRVLLIMLRNHLASAITHARLMQEDFKYLAGTDLKVWKGAAATSLRLQGVDRLIELQAGLMQFGRVEDANIASFIEACRDYQQQSESLIQAVSAVLNDEGPFKDLTKNLLRLRVKQVAESLDQLVDAANSIEQVIERERDT